MSSRVWRAVGIELAGVVAAIVLALIAVAHVASTAGSPILFYDGDSLPLPLLSDALLHGSPLHFVVSTTLFIPETLLYLACAAVASTVQGAIAVNAVVNVLVFYGIARGVAAVEAPRTGRGRRVALAVLGIAVFTAFVLFENSGAYNSFELFTLNLTGTYYWSTVVGMGGTAILVVGSIAGRTSAHRVLAVVGIGLIAAVCTLTSPLYIAWSVIPVLVLLALLLLIRRMTWRQGLPPAAAIVAGAVVGYAARGWFQPFLAADPVGYVHPLRVGHSVLSYGHAVIETASSSRGGIVVMVGIVVVLVVTAVAAIRMIRTRGSFALVAMPTLTVLTAVIITVGAILLGQDATRYLLPAAVLPVLLLPAIFQALGSHWSIPARWRRPVGWTALILLVAGAVLAPLAATVAVPSTRYSQADCLTDWIDGRDLVGAGQYWTIRPIQVYNPTVRLVQIEPLTEPYVWLNDLDAYRVRSIDYVVVDAPAAAQGWGTSLRQAYGDPGSVTTCDAYSIYDYDGTPGQAKLTHDIVSAAAKDRVARGWGP